MRWQKILEQSLSKNGLDMHPYNLDMLSGQDIINREKRAFKELEKNNRVPKSALLGQERENCIECAFESICRDSKTGKIIVCCRISNVTDANIFVSKHPTFYMFHTEHFIVPGATFKPDSYALLNARGKAGSWINQRFSTSEDILKNLIAENPHDEKILVDFELIVCSTSKEGFVKKKVPQVVSFF